jgi:hypothetical protein
MIVSPGDVLKILSSRLYLVRFNADPFPDELGLGKGQTDGDMAAMRAPFLASGVRRDECRYLVGHAPYFGEFFRYGLSRRALQIGDTSRVFRYKAERFLLCFLGIASRVFREQGETRGDGGAMTFGINKPHDLDACAIRIYVSHVVKKMYAHVSIAAARFRVKLWRV